ncbi:response regulator [Nitratidesulfovibrio liaohensis]|uniref:Response regulator n=1 Tax=Nitratidesulfovibrio liaohensis TaxID=2604158 RepID=A0ABY9R6S7_9BACT|nr:response regulator [Nitratidesulfovibrio liaohensis]NHZ48768.1 response regulator [Nitratidesulfovibrio liaohensis]WMW66907.1 response regulator [Nitratidesulfovibrio liaohensis]
MPSRLRILVLDDEPIVCKRLKPAFQKAGYEVETCTDSATALQRIAEAPFDVVVTDLKMEGADGLQVVERTHQIQPQARIVVITGFATLDTAKESFRKGAFDFVAKPFKLGDILDCVRRIEAELREGAERGDADGGAGKDTSS